MKNNTIPPQLVLVILGLIGFIVISSLAPFKNYLLSTLFPKESSQAAVFEWSQDGGDAQRTGFSPEEPVEPWTYLWNFNGSDSSGGIGNHIYNAPKEARTIMGGGRIYIPAGSRGVYALNAQTGSQVWNFTGATVNATAAYDSAGYVYVGGSNGTLYKINSTTGTQSGTYNAGSPINKAVLLVDGFVYVVTDSGHLHKVNSSNMTSAWSNPYSAGSKADTPPSYSSSRDAIVYATNDLNVHAVNNSNGTQKWKVKPTPVLPGNNGAKIPNTFDKAWPVIAEQHGVVFLRLQLNFEVHFFYPGAAGGKYPADLATIRNFLITNPDRQNLFALNLDDGSKKFIPVVGYGTTEDWNGTQAVGVMGSQPAVKIWPDGKEVAYIHFRSGIAPSAIDFRWDGHMGEMVLDDTTIPGLQAGDLRYVKSAAHHQYTGSSNGNCYTDIIDEQTPLTLAGDTLINAHWAASCSFKITDRSNARGLSFGDPIKTISHLPIVRAMLPQGCTDFNFTTRKTNCGLHYYTDGGRYFGGPGFWSYWGVADPPGWNTSSGNTGGSGYSAGVLPRYTYVANGLMVVEGNGGDLMVFKHSGQVAATSPSPSAQPSVSPPAGGSGPAISNVSSNSNTVRVYEKYEVKFDVATTSEYPYTPYDTNPPPGVTPGIGVSVDGVFTANGKTWRQPAFYMTESVKVGSGNSMYFEETGKKYWVVRFSPQETGTYQVSLTATDTSGTSNISAGSFSATTPVKKGFIKVAGGDKRYFEYSNGELYFPIGPAAPVNNDYSSAKDSGPNLERPWLGGRGIYSTNWARWKSSAESLGNEGMMTRLNWREKLPGHDLSYEIFYPAGFRMWQTTWIDDAFGPRIKAGKTYQVKLVYKSANIAGPRNSGFPYGFVVKTGDYPWGYVGQDAFDNALRNSQQIVAHNSTNHDWITINTTFTANSNRTDLFLYLDNVTAGQVYVDEFSMREILPDTSLGGEIVRNPRADEHMFIEQRPAAFVDWQVEQGEANDVYFKYVVHDKNDWIQNHLLTNGQWADQGNGYYQDENTKARWLLRQWYRYLAARWGYSTAIHSWELNNEGPPNAESPGTASHWRTAQAFAKFMHDTDSHRHLATTSFWCCWRPEFWGNNTSFPDIDYADLHMYTDNTDGIAPSTPYDLALWTYNTSLSIYNNGYPSGQNGVGKPSMRAETGVHGTAFDLLKQPNPGLWFHELLWAQLNEGALFDVGYWWSEHLDKINRFSISKPFHLFTKGLDLNKGGYTPLSSSTNNPKLRSFGQKNITTNKAHLWIQNADHTWKNVMDGINSSQSGNISFTMNANTTYTVVWWNTYSGVISKTETLQSDSAGKLTLQISNLTDDTAVQISSGSPTPTSSPRIPGDIEPVSGDGDVDIFDYNQLVGDFGRTGSGIVSDIDPEPSGDGDVDIFDYNVLVTNFGR